MLLFLLLLASSELERSLPAMLVPPPYVHHAAYVMPIRSGWALSRGVINPFAPWTEVRHHQVRSFCSSFVGVVLFSFERSFVVPPEKNIIFDKKHDKNQTLSRCMLYVAYDWIENKQISKQQQAAVGANRQTIINWKVAISKRWQGRGKARACLNRALQLPLDRAPELVGAWGRRGGICFQCLSLAGYINRQIEMLLCCG